MFRSDVSRHARYTVLADLNENDDCALAGMTAAVNLSLFNTLSELIFLKSIA